MFRILETKGSYHDLLCRKEYSKQHVDVVESIYDQLSDLGNDPLLMLGEIQSGKTSMYIAVTALCLDNGYQLVVVLTKSGITLTSQTVTRLQADLGSNQINVTDIMYMPLELTPFELSQKKIIVVKKQTDNFRRLKNLLKKFTDSDRLKCLIIDDESDFASVGYKKDDDEQYNFTTIAGYINQTRVKLSDCRFIQVTATPYANLIQPRYYNNFESDALPTRPPKIFLLPTGDGYIGGEYYFNETKYPLGKYLHSFLEESNLTILQKSTLSTIELDNPDLRAIKNAIMNFIVGGTIRMLQNGGDIYDPANRYSFIVHTDLAKKHHKHQAKIFELIIGEFQTLERRNRPALIPLIMKSIEELNNSIIAYGFTPIKTEVLLPEIYTAIKERIKISIVNSDNSVSKMLDVNGQLELTVPLNIFIGGQILDRGITIRNLIGFIYGRNPKTMMMDTVLQHARMYGYRSKEDLSVTRLYTTSSIYKRLVMINQQDQQLRDNIRKYNSTVLFPDFDTNNIRYTNSRKTCLTDIYKLKSNSKIFPSDFDVINDIHTQNIVSLIDSIIHTLNPCHKNSSEFSVPASVARDILNNVFSTITLSKKETVNYDVMCGLL